MRKAISSRSCFQFAVAVSSGVADPERAQVASCRGQIHVRQSRGPRIAVVEPADSRKCDDLACVRRFDGARDRRVAIERHVRSVLVVIGDMLADQPEQVPLPKHDQVIEQLAT